MNEEDQKIFKDLLEQENHSKSGEEPKTEEENDTKYSEELIQA